MTLVLFEVLSKVILKILFCMSYSLKTLAIESSKATHYEDEVYYENLIFSYVISNLNLYNVLSHM